MGPNSLYSYLVRASCRSIFRAIMSGSQTWASSSRPTASRSACPTCFPSWLLVKGRKEGDRPNTSTKTPSVSTYRTPRTPSARVFTPPRTPCLIRTTGITTTTTARTATGSPRRDFSRLRSNQVSSPSTFSRWVTHPLSSKTVRREVENMAKTDLADRLLVSKSKSLSLCCSGSRFLTTFMCSRRAR